MTSAPEEPVIISGRQYRSVKEGLATILAPYQTTQKAPRKGQNNNNDEGHQAVFYNPIQQFNRDLSVLAILIHGEDAVLEKESRMTRKQHPKGKQKRAVQNSTASNKRKASQLDGSIDDDADLEGPPKRQKVSEVDTNGNTTTAEDYDGDNLEVNAQDEPVISASVSTEPHQTNASDEPAIPDTVSTEKQVTHDRPFKQRKAPYTILDALSATGLRALRYAKEIPFATNIVANDLLAEAVKSIELNIDHNDVRDKVHSNVADARAYMYSKIGNEKLTHEKGYVHRFDVIDLDPYGTAAPFLDSAIQALQDGGLLCVTCTDAGVFASNGYPEKAFALYGGTTLKGAHSHEAGLRLILNAVAMSAAKYQVAIEPLLSLSIDFYARLFIRVHKQQQRVKLLSGTTMVVYNCDSGCGAWTTQLIGRNTAQKDKIGDLMFKYGYAQAPTTTPNCEHCGCKTHIGGPMYAGVLHNPYFVQRILDRLPSLDPSVYKTLDRIRGMLTLALEEDLTLASSNTAQEPNDKSSSTKPDPDPRIIPRVPAETIDQTPFFFIPNFLAKILHCTTPNEDRLRGAIRHLGYRVTRSHCKPGSFKTDAPWSVLWEIMREWVRTKAPIKPGAVGPTTPGWKILRGTRGTVMKKVDDFKSDLQSRMARCESMDDVKTLLESSMWKIENDKIDANGSGAVNGLNEQSDGVSDNDGVVRDGTDGSKAKDSREKTDLKLSRLDVVFDEKLGREKPRGNLVRFQINPRKHWGPMNRAGGAR